MRRRETTASTLTSHTDNLRTVVFLKDGALASVSQSGHVIVWDLRTATPATEYHLSERLASCLAISADGKRVATGSTDGRVNVFDTVKVSTGTTVGG